VNLANESINTSAHVALDLEERRKEGKFDELVLPLKILAVIPLNDRVLKFAHSVGVAEDLEHSVPHCSLLSVITISQYGV
jgi:hypothetical protein